MQADKKLLMCSKNLATLKADPVVQIIAIPTPSLPENAAMSGRYASQDTQLAGESEDIFLDNFIKHMRITTMTPELETEIKQILNHKQKFKIANFIKPTFDDEGFLFDIMPILNVA